MRRARRLLPLAAMISCVAVSGCLTFSYGRLSPEQQEFLRIQRACRDLARAESEQGEVSYSRAYERCLQRLGG